jgi:N utilization substance protein B
VDPRSAARRLAMQFLYQLAIQNGANMDQMDSFLNEYGEHPETKQLAQGWIKGAWQATEQIEKLIGSVSSNWDLTRISQVDRSNLHLAVYQLIYRSDIPAKVVINEAVEMAKIFSTAQAPAFINGILDAVWKNLIRKSKN